MTRDRINWSVDKDGDLTNRDVNKTETFNASSSLFSAMVMSSGAPRALSWRAITMVITESQLTLNLYGICCSTRMHTSLWGVMELIPRVQRSGIISHFSIIFQQS